MSQDVWDNLKLPYNKFLQAIFGAVFLDAGGSKGEGIEECFKVFLKLWEDFDTKINHIKALKSCFQVQKEIKNYWIRMGMNESFIFFAEDRFNVKFTNSDILCEALIHQTFYDVIRNDRAYSGLHKPDYERLKFLGETVLGLLITELTYHEYPDAEASFIYDLANAQIHGDRLMEVVERLQLRQSGLVRTHKNVVLGNYDDILKAVIGAIYVNGGEDSAREFILREFQLIKPEGLNLERSMKRRGLKEEENPIGNMSKDSIKEQMDSNYMEGERFYINQRIERYGMLHEICYSNILPFLWKIGGACKGVTELIKFLLKILFALGIVVAIFISE
ncbi:unnamed protein product [Orchesella dallaii]|uniref:RNase III domain-containing protein n=1 Tax=Orchesella dallaii TaxID=48710 RepID=A0ABP1S0Q0_9HEXA